eukprot:5461921-Pyramimonas_sp.AAC.1
MAALETTDNAHIPDCQRRRPGPRAADVPGGVPRQIALQNKLEAFCFAMSGAAARVPHPITDAPEVRQRSPSGVPNVDLGGLAHHSLRDRQPAL